MRVDEAPEPSNIIWENLEIESDYSRSCEIIVYFVIFIILLMIFIFYCWLQGVVVSNQKKYPRDFECAAVDSLFGFLDFESKFDW